MNMPELPDKRGLADSITQAFWWTDAQVDALFAEADAV